MLTVTAEGTITYSGPGDIYDNLERIERRELPKYIARCEAEREEQIRTARAWQNRTKKREKQSKLAQITEPITKHCKYCGKEFETYLTGKSFCDTECRDKYREEENPLVYRRCVICGRVFQKTLKSEREICSNKMCKYKYSKQPKGETA